MIKINKIDIELEDLYGPNDEYLGKVNLYEFNDIRLQVVKERVEGYYILSEGIKYHLYPNGEIVSGNKSKHIFNKNDEIIWKILLAV